MMKKTVNSFLIFIIVIILFSCKKEVNNKYANPEIQPISVSVSDDRIVFQNFEEYISTYKMLSKFHTVDDLRFWAQSKMHSTLLDSEDSTIVNYSGALKTILNKDSEFQLGDSIVVFYKGILYSYSKHESGKTSLLDNPEKFRKVGAIRSTPVGKKQSKSVVIPPTGTNKINSPFDLVWYQPCGGVLEGPYSQGQAYRQFVSQLYDETFIYPYWYGPIFFSTLYLYIKLEERTSSIPWRTCWNHREVNFQVEGTAKYRVGLVDFDMTIPLMSGNYNCDTGIASGPLFWAIASGDGTNMDGYFPYWIVSLYGYITQHVCADDTTVTLPPDYPSSTQIW